MEARLKIRYSKNYLRERSTKFRRQVKCYRIRMSFVWLGAAAIIAAGIAVIIFSIGKNESPKTYVFGTVLVAIGFVLVFAPWLNDIGSAWFLGKWPFLNEICETSISEDGIRSVVKTGDSFVNWTGFTRAILFPDGIMLFQWKDDFTWYPAANFTSPDDYQNALAIIQKNIREIRVIRG